MSTCRERNDIFAGIVASHSSPTQPDSLPAEGDEPAAETPGWSVSKDSPKKPLKNSQKTNSVHSANCLGSMSTSSLVMGNKVAHPTRSSFSEVPYVIMLRPLPCFAISCCQRGDLGATSSDFLLLSNFLLAAITSPVVGS